MKHIPLFILVLWSNNCSCQNNEKSAIEHVDSIELKTQNNIIRWQMRKAVYENYLKTHIEKVDTIYFNRDSVKITFLNKDKRRIKDEFKSYIKPTPFSSDTLSISDSIVKFYNTDEQVIYIESWSFIGGSAYDTPEQGMFQSIILSEPYLSYYIRVDYDYSKHDVLSVIKNLSFIKRFRKKYDNSGNLIKSTDEDIKEYEFWDK